MEIQNIAKGYRSGNHMIFSCQYHVIFCSKYRRPILKDEIEVRLKNLILEKQEKYEYKVLDMEVMPDHVHLLLDINPKVGVFYIVNQIKGYTSRIIRNEFPEIKRRLPTLWTRSKFISSVGAVTLEVVKRYIEEQKGK